MDDLLALMDDHQTDEVVDTSIYREREPLERIRNSKTSSSPPQSLSQGIPISRASISSGAEANIDTKLGIRMLNRKIGSIDLLELVSSNPYHSPAALVKMKTADLNQLLQDPSPVIDQATVTGRTNLLTIGIVFTNSGTKISKTGRAFSILAIGNLATGPIVTVFLFGDTYSKMNNLCIPGIVIALVNPSIVPSNQTSLHNDKPLSLSVNDKRQLLVVAKARDFDVCKGTTRLKSHDGRLVDLACRCHVDTRIGRYCAKHSQQGKAVSGKASHEQSFVQKMRNEVIAQRLPGSLSKQNFSDYTILNKNKEAVQVSSLKAYLHNATKNDCQGPILKNKMETKAILNPYHTENLNTGPQRLVTLTTDSTSHHLQGDWLKEATKHTLHRKRKLHTPGNVQFDGCVMVPQAHPMLRAAAPKHVQQRTSTVGAIHDRTNLLLERQKALSLALRDKSNHQSTAAERIKGIMPKKSSAASTAFFPDLDINTNAVLNARSQFEREANAEAYARSRNAVTDLEKLEQRELQKVAKRTEHCTAHSKVLREWLCVNCKRTSRVAPKMCKHLGHSVILKRLISENDSLVEQRLKLQDKGIEDGGIILGAGVEWTAFTKL